MKSIGHAYRRSSLRPPDDDGISLTEVMVAITLLAITMAATASGVVRALQVARDSREAVIAANVAQFELERLRSIPFVDWVSATQSDPDSVTTTTGQFAGPDGQVYQVDRTATWVDAGATADGCSTAATGTGAGADYVRVTQTVTFPGRALEPITNTTIITPRISDFDPARGNLAVIVRDRDGRGASGHLVQVSNPAVRVATTDADGCAFFALLPASPDDPAANVYRLRIDTPGHVESSLQVQEIDEQVTVAAQSTTVREYEYDRGAAYDPVPRVAPPVAGCVLTLVDLGSPQAVDGIANLSNAPDPTTLAVDPEPSGPPYVPNRLGLECRDGSGSAVPEGWMARLPANLAYTIYNPATTFSSLGRQTVYADLAQTAVPDTQVRPGREIGPLFPYRDGYGIHAGRCPAADPEGVGGNLRIIDATPGADGSLDVDLALVTVTSVNPAGTNVEPLRHVFADMRDDASCTDGDRLYLGRTDTAGRLTALMPYGAWVFYSANAPSGSDSTPAVPIGCADITEPAACVEIRADGVITEDPVTGAPCPTPTYAFCGAVVNPAVGYEITTRHVSAL